MIDNITINDNSMFLIIKSYNYLILLQVKKLLRITNPTYSIISASLNNKYNHPSKETIYNLNKYNLTYYKTSISDTIRYCFSTNEVKQYSYNP